MFGATLVGKTIAPAACLVAMVPLYVCAFGQLACTSSRLKDGLQLGLGDLVCNMTNSSANILFHICCCVGG